MNFKNFPTPHCHSAASLDTASTPERFADWELAHETGALTVTDHGTLAGTRKVYDLLKEDKYKGKVRPILGLEAYFRDDDCEVLKRFDIRAQPRYRNESRTKFKDDEEYQKLDEEGKAKWTLESSTAYYQKYMHLTMHFLDQKAYETGIKRLSHAEFNRCEKHGSEFKPLFNWNDLEEIAASNTIFCTGCLIGMIQRHVAFGQRNDIAEAYLQKILSIIKPENLYVEVFPHICDRNWSSKVVLHMEDGTTMDIPPWKKLKTDRKYGKSEGISAEDLYASWGKKQDHGALRAIMVQRKWEDIPEPKKIINVEFREEFIQNECSPFTPDGDLQKPANEFMLAMAEKYKLPVLISDDSHFVSPDEKIVQDIKLLQDGDWRFHTSYHRLTSEEAFKYFKNTMGKDEKWFEATVENNFAWASRFKDFKLQPRPSLPTSFYPTDTLAHTWRLIQQHGRQIFLNDPKYAARLVAEVKLLHQNGTIDLLPYFFIDEEVVELYNKAGEITGSGRGSAAGMLLAYLLEITHIDPLKFGLSMDRFLTIDRIQSGKLPDIDQDLPHTDLLMHPDNPKKGWLADRFGDCFAQISTDTSIKLKSAILDVHRVTASDRRVPKEVADLAHRLQTPPQGISDSDFVFGYDANGEWQTGSIETDPILVEYVKRFPTQWNVVKECLGIPKGKGRHPCGVVITNEPVDNFIPLLNQNGHKVTAFTAAQVEAAGALKVDFLRLKALQMIKHCIDLVQKQHNPELAAIPRGQRYEVDGKMVPIQRVVRFKDKYYDLWDLPEDQAVFMDICEGNTESVFQFGTPTAKKWLKNFNHWRVQDERKALDSIEAIAAFTALDRPGPLDAYVTEPSTGKQHNMLVEFARRARGEPAIGSFPILMQLFPETYGVLTYQEQLQKTFLEIGRTTPIQANDFRIHVGKKQMKKILADKAVFMPGAIESVGVESAEAIWASMETAGQYSFNKSHAVSYATDGYATAFLKHYFPTQWWTSVLSYSKKEDIQGKYWNQCKDLILLPDISKSSDIFQVEGEHIRAPLNLLTGVGPAAHEELKKYHPVTSLFDLANKIKAHKENGPDGKKQRSALHSGIISSLISGGAMDSLFEPGLSIAEKINVWINIKADVFGTRHKKTGIPKEVVNPKFRNLTDLQQYQLKKMVLPISSEDLSKYITDPNNITIARLRPRKVQNSWLWSYDLEDTHGNTYYLTQRAFIEEVNRQGFTWPSHRGSSINLCAVAYVIEQEKMYSRSDGTPRIQVTLDIEGFHLRTVVWQDKQTKIFPEPWKSQDLTGSIVLVALRKWNPDRDLSLDHTEVICTPFEFKEESSKKDDNG